MHYCIAITLLKSVQTASYIRSYYIHSNNRLNYVLDSYGLYNYQHLKHNKLFLCSYVHCNIPDRRIHAEVPSINSGKIISLQLAISATTELARYLSDAYNFIRKVATTNLYN